ncbi:hypothetical protein PHMEG_00024560, partial [Phytophthora megakarya]
LADTSRRQYDSTWEQWTSFSNRFGRSPMVASARPSLQLIFFAIERWSHPVSRSMLDWIATNIDYKKPKHRLVLGAALLGFFYLLRSSEFLAVKGGRHNYALEVRDVEVLDITGRPAVTFDRATHAVTTLRGIKKDKVHLASSTDLEIHESAQLSVPH